LAFGAWNASIEAVPVPAMVITSVAPEVWNLEDSNSWPPRITLPLDAIAVKAAVPIPMSLYSVPTPMVGVTDPPTAVILTIKVEKSKLDCAVVACMVMV